MADEIKVSTQQISHIAAGCLLISFFIFIAGYYWGKKNGLEPLVDQYKAEAFSDKIYHALCAIDAPDSPTRVLNEQSEEIAHNAVNSQEFYYALLARHSSLATLQIWSDKLKQQEINTRIIEHIGKTAKGRARTWYELLSQTYTNKQNLEEDIERMKKLVPLHVHTIEIMSLDV